MKIYVDTNVFLRLLKDESLEEEKALIFDFFSKGWNCEFEIVLSSWTRSEFKRYLDEVHLTLLLQQFKNKGKFYFVSHSSKDTLLAKQKTSHWQDELHLMLAIKSKSDVIVTLDKGFISYASQVFDITYPENALNQRS